MQKIPTRKEEWRHAAKAEGVQNTKLGDLSDLEPASSLPMKDFLCLRAIWTEHGASEMTPEALGITKEDLQAAKDHLGPSDDFREYIKHVHDTGENKIALGKMKDLGLFTLVRHFQLQITKDNEMDDSAKHIISPVVTRQRARMASADSRRDSPGKDPGPAGPATPETRLSRLDFHGLKEALPSRELVRKKGESSSEPSSQGSPLGRRGLPGKSNDPPHSKRSSSGEERSPFPDRASDHSALSATAARIHYAATPDEMIVNTSIILLLNALAAHNPKATAEWVLTRLVLRYTMGNAHLEARTDGYLRGSAKQSLKAILEVKARARSVRTGAIKIQETAQIVASIASEGFPGPSSRRFVLVSQDLQEVYLTIAEYDTDYIKYLKGEDDKNAPLSLLKMRSFGPWKIYSASSLSNLCGYLLAITLNGSKE